MTDERLRVLLAEDDRAVRESLARAMTLEGYEVSAVNDGAAALQHLRDDSVDAPPDIIILDVSMPAVDGLTVCRVLRSEGVRIPILLLTARTEPSDRIAGLDAGADDYVLKPFDLGELFARLRALVRRLVVDADEHSGVEPLVLDDLVMDLAGRRVQRGSRELELSKTEFDLLELLIRNAG
ncbi:MAG: response regulator transcription factor, partial [Actinomycetota bacterium]|nr:response regulator transcription factor [Actinomycetota bacterium]